MKPRKTVTVEVDTLLDLLNCAETYGFADDVFFDTIAGFLDYKCSDREIENYAAYFLSDEMREQGYGDEDFEEAVDRLTRWRDRYCKPKTKD